MMLGMIVTLAQLVACAVGIIWLWRGGASSGTIGGASVLGALIVGSSMVGWIGVIRGVNKIAAAASAPLAARHGASVPSAGLAELDVIATALDSSARAQHAQAARIAAIHQEQQAILQSMDGGVLVIDAEQRILSMNRAAEWMLGITGSASRGRLLQEVSRQPDLHRFVGEAFADETEDREFALQGAPARRVRAAHTRLLDAEGKPVGLLVVLSDLTQLRRLESVRTDFAANVSHELRTPITNIKGYVETLLDMNGEADAAQNERFLRIIQRNADRLGAIVEDMLMLTQLERPGIKETLSTERTRVAQIVQMVDQNLEDEAAAKNMTILTSVPDELWAMVNPQLAEQAISNLVVNAIKYSPAGKRVWIRARAIEPSRDGVEMVELAVIDEGPGIGEEHLSRVFERFYRVDKARSREAGGTGLGLAIVKHIVHLHGGRVDVESAEGQGSTFRVALPAG
jgi:two-component system phosphate regulon sensor histidine kinase PhoR